MPQVRLLIFIFSLTLNIPIHTTKGHPPVLPEFASGFWQCKNRYRNQSELLDIAQGYLDRSLPISVIVVDYLHWDYYGTAFDSIAIPKTSHCF